MAILQRIISLWKIIILLAIVQISVTGCGQNVVDYYNSLPETFFSDKDLGDIKYPLYKKGDIWFSHSSADNEFTPVVDIKNGYIEFNDEGTGGGNVNTKIVLFRKKDDSPLIGITMGGYNGIYFESSTAFYELKNDEWIKTNNVFPELKIKRFLNKKYQDLYFKRDDIVTPNLTTLTELPQLGTTIKIDLNFSKYDFLIEANHNPITQKSFTELEQEKLWEIIDNISIESFQLEFNKTEDKFVVADSTFLNNPESNPIFVEQDSGEMISDKTYIFKQLWELKIVTDLASYIDSVSNQTRELELIFEGVATDNSDFYLVRGIEDNGGNYVTHIVFHIHKKSFEIYKYDAVEDVFKKIDP